jgi:hypothetical protein
MQIRQVWPSWQIWATWTKWPRCLGRRTVEATCSQLAPLMGRSRSGTYSNKSRFGQCVATCTGLVPRLGLTRLSLVAAKTKQYLWETFAPPRPSSNFLDIDRKFAVSDGVLTTKRLLQVGATITNWWFGRSGTATLTSRSLSSGSIRLQSKQLTGVLYTGVSLQPEEELQTSISGFGTLLVCSLYLQ